MKLKTNSKLVGKLTEILKPFNASYLRANWTGQDAISVPINESIKELVEEEINSELRKIDVYCSFSNIEGNNRIFALSKVDEDLSDEDPEIEEIKSPGEIRDGLELVYYKANFYNIVLKSAKLLLPKGRPVLTMEHGVVEVEKVGNGYGGILVSFRDKEGRLFCGPLFDVFNCVDY